MRFWKAWLELHLITKIMSVCALVGAAVAAASFAAQIRPFVQYGGAADAGLGQAVTGVAFDLVWALGFLGTAATVEFMYRIWRELVRANGVERR